MRKAQWKFHSLLANKTLGCKWVFSSASKLLNNWLKFHPSTMSCPWSLKSSCMFKIIKPIFSFRYTHARHVEVKFGWSWKQILVFLFFFSQTKQSSEEKHEQGQRKFLIKHVFPIKILWYPSKISKTTQEIH